MIKVKYSNVLNKNLGGERNDKLLESGIKLFKMSYMILWCVFILIFNIVMILYIFGVFKK